MGGAGIVVGLTGATGHLGGLLLDRLRADPDVAEVRSAARRPVSTSGPGAPVAHVCADLRDRGHAPGTRRGRYAVPPGGPGLGRPGGDGPGRDAGRQCGRHPQRAGGVTGSGGPGLVGRRVRGVA